MVRVVNLQSFTFHPHPIQVDGRAIHGVRVGDLDVTSVQLIDGVLIVCRGTRIWFTHTSYGTGMPIDESEQYEKRLAAEQAKQDLLTAGTTAEDASAGRAMKRKGKR